MAILTDSSRVSSLSLNTENQTPSLDSLQRELEFLRSDSNRTAVIQNIIELLYDVHSEEEVVSIMLYALPQIFDFKQLRYFKYDRSALRLVESKSIVESGGFAEEVVDGLVYPLDFFGGLLADSVIRQESMTIENGIEEGDELAIRFNSNRYTIFPLIARSIQSKTTVLPIREEFHSDLEFQQAILKSPDYPVVGCFWIDLSNIDESHFIAGISHVNTLFRTSGAIVSELRMVKRMVEINDRIEKDLEAARVVQNGLLPAKLPNTGRVQAAARYITEDQVGGDYYDIFEIKNGLYGIMVADASGHGTPSALIMAMTKILLKTFATPERSPSETLEMVNKAIVTNAKTNKFITGLYGLLNTETNTFRYTSAGHCPQLYMKKSTGEVKHLVSDGMFIGMFPMLMVQDHEITFEPGDTRLILYTDGLTEATNSIGTMYGINRLVNSSRANLTVPPEEALENILGLFKQFIKMNKKEDDLTLMIVDF